MYYCNFRYCYLLNDLTPDLLRSKCSSYEDLQDYLRLRGREAYLQKRVSKTVFLAQMAFPFYHEILPHLGRTP
jgi:preprotein translocase subunit SecA